MPPEEAGDKAKGIIRSVNAQFDADTTPFRSLTEEKQGFNKYHISLTKLFFLRDFQISPFVSSVRNAVRASPFQVTLSSPHVFTNEDKTRSFCSVLVQRGFNSVVKIIRQLDAVLEKYKKDTYYSPPIPHCTIGSCVGDKSEKAKELGIYGNDVEEEDEYDSDDEDCIEFEVDAFYLCIGNQTHTISLRSVVCWSSLPLAPHSFSFVVSSSLLLRCTWCLHRVPHVLLS